MVEDLSLLPHRLPSSVTCRSISPLIFLVILAIFGGITLSIDRILSRRGGGGIESFGTVRNKIKLVVDMQDDDRYNSDDDDDAVERLAQHVQDLIGSDDKDKPNNTLSIVCQLSGELGNNLGKFVHAYVLWLKLTRAAASQAQEVPAKTTSTRYDPSFQYRIVLRHQLRSKWINGRDDAQLCFPDSLGRFDFARGNGPDYDQRLGQQTQRHWMELFHGVNDAPEHVQGALDNFTSIAAASRQDEIARVGAHGIDSDTMNLTNSPISLPFLLSDTMAGHPQFVEFIDEYYHEIRRLLKFDIQACCALQPYPDESVFHHRNFVQEMPKAGIRLGYEEMGPNQTARDLFGHLQPGDKVAILSRRIKGSNHEDHFVQALERQGLQVRFVHGQTGVQDFCFLMSAQKELIGPGKSTYFFWAAILGKAKKIRYYLLDTPETRERNRGNHRVDYVWKTPELRERFKFELHKVDRDLGRRWLSVVDDD